MKKYYFAIQICQNNKYYALLLPVLDYQNVYAVLNGISGIVSATICKSKAAAQNKVNAWNNAFQKDGVFMFSDNF